MGEINSLENKCCDLMRHRSALKAAGEDTQFIDERIDNLLDDILLKFHEHMPLLGAVGCDAVERV